VAVCSRQALGLLWSHYVSTLAAATPSVADHVLTVYHTHLVTLPWHAFFPDMHAIQLMVKVSLHFSLRSPRRIAPLNPVSFCSYCLLVCMAYLAFGALTLLVGRQEGHLACKKTEWWGAGMVVCLERGADLHTAQLMPLPLTVSCFSKIQTGFTFLVPAHPGTVTVMIVPSSASWSRFSPPSDFVNGHVSAVWFVCLSLARITGR